MRDLEIAALVGAAGFVAYSYVQYDGAGDGLGKKANTCGRGGPCYPKKAPVRMGPHRHLNPHQQSLIDRLPGMFNKMVDSILQDPIGMGTMPGMFAGADKLLNPLATNVQQETKDTVGITTSDGAFSFLDPKSTAKWKAEVNTSLDKRIAHKSIAPQIGNAIKVPIGIAAFSADAVSIVSNGAIAAGNKIAHSGFGDWLGNTFGLDNT